MQGLSEDRQSRTLVRVLLADVAVMQVEGSMVSGLVQDRRQQTLVIPGQAGHAVREVAVVGDRVRKLHRLADRQRDAMGERELLQQLPSLIPELRVVKLAAEETARPTSCTEQSADQV